MTIEEQLAIRARRSASMLFVDHRFETHLADRAKPWFVLNDLRMHRALVELSLAGDDRGRRRWSRWFAREFRQPARSNHHRADHESGEKNSPPSSLHFQFSWSGRRERRSSPMARSRSVIAISNSAAASMC